MALRIPKYPSKASGTRFALNVVVSLFWAPYRYPLKIRETGRELALWPKLYKNTQQPTRN
jgi:hypothetical protein